MWRRRLADPGSSERTTWNSLIQQLKDSSSSSNASNSNSASNPKKSSSSTFSTIPTQGQPQQSKDNNTTLIDILVEINGIILPNNAITGEDCGNMIVTIATTVPLDDLSLCQRACDTIDRIVRTVEVSLQSRHIDILVQFLLQCTNPTNTRTMTNHHVSTGSNGTDEVCSLEKSLAASSLRGLGCIIYENAERCTKWYDTFINRLIPFINSNALPSSSALVNSSSASALVPSSPPSTSVAVAVPYSTSTSVVLPLSDDTVHATLVCLGNLVIRAGSKVKDKHSILYPHILRVLSWGTLLPAQTLPEVQMAGRILSSALRTLLPILQASDSNVRNQFLRTSEDLLRILRDLTTFGWKCDALNRPRKHRLPRSSTNTAGNTVVSPLHSVPMSSNDGNNEIIKSSDPRKTNTSLNSDPGLRTPDRFNHTTHNNGNNSGTEHSGTENGEISDRGSVTSRGSTATRSRWQLIHQQNNYRNTPSSNPAGTVSSNNPPVTTSSTTNPSTTNNTNLRGVGGSSWYTNSDSEDNDDGGGSESGAGFSVAGWTNSSKLKRRIPVRVRATALHCISALAKHSPKLLQSRWELFIPQVQGLSTKPYSVSLLTVLLYDSSHRVQEAAASSLATIVQDAPLNRWIALPTVHNAASAIRSSKQGTTPDNNNGSIVTGVNSTVTGKPATSPSSSRTAGLSSTNMKRAFNSLSDKTSAMVGELHKALSKALSNVDPERFPSLATALLRCAGNVMAVTPYDRLSSGMAYDLCGRAVNLLDCKVQTVAVAALQCIASTFGNTAAVSDIALAQPSSDEMKVISSNKETDTIVTVSSLNHLTGLPENFSRAHQLLRALIAHSGRSSGVSPVIRTELLAVLAKAARHHSPLLASCWSSLQPLLLDAFSDASPQVRTAALKVIEEILHVRAMILATKVPSITESGTHTNNTGTTTTNEELGIGEDDDNENDKPMMTELSGNGLSGISLPTLDTWNILDQRTNDTSVIDISNLLRRYLRAALRDVSPTVRAAATMCTSYLLPLDWAVSLNFPTGSLDTGEENDLSTENTTGGTLNDSVKERDELLQLLASSSFDTTPTVRVAAARVWGAYLAYPEWKTRAFAQASGRILLGLVVDENLSVRAKASWALGNLCAPLSTSPAHAAALAAAVTKRMRESTSTAIAQLTQQDPIIGAASSPLFTLYPAIGEVDPLSDIHNLNRIPGWLPDRCKPFPDSDDTDTGAGGGGGGLIPLSPLELYWSNVSQAALVNLLTLPFLRIVTRAVLDTTTDHDKVSCTAVRTLGYCVQALLYHWLPLPESVRDFVNPVVLSSQSNGNSTNISNNNGKSSLSVKRADISACPDDELIKKAMLALADIVAGTAVVLDKKGSVSPIPSSTPVTEITVTNGDTNEDNGTGTNNEKSKNDIPVPTGTGKQKTLPSQNWQEVDEDEDVREVIARRLQGPSMRHMKHQTTNENNPKNDKTEEEESHVVGTDPKEKRNNNTGNPVNVAKGPTSTGSFSSKFRFNTKSSRGVTNGADTANWREKPTKNTSSSNGGSTNGSTNTTNPNSKEEKDNGTGTMISSTTVATVGKRSNTSASSSSASGTVMKVRWNACHAVAQIIPLAHRLVNTHPQNNSLNDTVDTDGNNVVLPLSNLPISQANISNNPKDTVNINSLVDIHYLTQPSPPRPRVRRDVSSGQSLMWAGVDHISTANSPFVPKDLQPPLRSQSNLNTPLNPSSGNLPTNTNSSGCSNQSSLPSTTMNTPQRPVKSSSVTIHPIDSLPLLLPSSSSSVAIVTDPTYPSVSIGTTWVPPTLAALHLALTQCTNFKVRIAAAQALGTVPSRMAYRIPSSSSLAPPPTTTTPSIPTLPLPSATQGDSTPTLSTNNALVNGIVNANTAFPLAPSSHIAPALQRPGYDAYPPALVGLLAALEGSEETHDYTEFRYKDQLKGVIRLSLVRTIRLAERMDYGRMKPFFDEKAELLYSWLIAEENLVNVLPTSVPMTKSSATLTTNGTLSDTVTPNTNNLAMVNSSTSVDPPLVPTNTVGPIVTINIDDVPIRTSVTPPFGILQPHPSLEIQDIYACFQHLASLFQSRVKTIPPELLKKFQEKAGKDNSMVM